MNKLQTEIGERLRGIRENIFFSGVKLSAKQFADKLGSTVDKIRNYETGRSSVSDEFLVMLYRSGINPIFVLTGEGSVFSPNDTGRQLEEVSGNSKKTVSESIPSNYETEKMSDNELIDLFTVAAGDLKKRLEEKRGRY